MLINGIDMDIKLLRAPHAFYVLSTSEDNKVRFKVSDTTLLITQVELKRPLVLAHGNVSGLKRKELYLFHIRKIKIYCVFWGQACLYR